MASMMTFNMGTNTTLPTESYENHSQLVEDYTSNVNEEDISSVLSSAGSGPQWAWIPYIFVFGTIFSVISIWSMVNLVVLIHRKNVASRGYHITLNFLMLLVGCLRLAAFTFSRLPMNTVPIAVVWVLSHLPVPCLNSAFFLLWSALKAMTRMRLVAGQLFRPWFLAVLVITNKTVAISADLITLYLVPSGMVMTLCRVYFVVLGTVGFACFLWDFQALYKATVVNRRWIHDHGDAKEESAASSTSPSTTASTDSGRKLAAEKKPTKLPVVVKVTLVAACLLLSISLWNSCDLTFKFLMSTKVFSPSSVVTWSYMSFMRCSESAMAATILFVTSLPLYKR